MAIKKMDLFVIEDFETEFEKELTPVLENIVEKIKSNAPVRLGTVKNSIMFKMEKGRGTIGASGIGSSLLHIVERGTVPRKKKNGGSTGSMPAKPFFYPTISSFEKEIDDVVKKVLGGVVK